MAPRRIPALALTADVVAVAVFAAVGRAAHGGTGLAGLVATAAPFLVGLGAAWATPLVRAHPTGWRAAAVVTAGAVVVGLALRAAFSGRLPLSFAVVTVVTTALLLGGWRGVAALVSRRGTAVRRSVR